MWEICTELIKKNDYKELQKQIDTNRQLLFMTNESDESLLAVSATYDAYDCTFLLIQNGAEINIRSKFSLTPLMIATVYDRFEIIELLIEQGAEVSLRDEDGDSAFNMAMEDFEVVGDKRWFNFFELYKDRFDEKDVALYHSYRIQNLFSSE
jgi:ankyrin repeat protein